MTYDPVAYWDRRGRVYARRFARARYVDQEVAIRTVLDGLEAPRTVLDVGCGFGRMAEIVSEAWPGVRYTGLDLSASMLARARHRFRRAELVHASLTGFRPRGRRWDLALAVEVLMHIPPAEIGPAIDRLLELAPVVVTVDWTESIPEPPAAHNFRHDYAALFAGRAVDAYRVGSQTIRVVRAA